MKATARFRFYADLNDFLGPDQRQQAASYSFRPPQSVKHLIESAGVPHPEVALIVANGTPVDFSYKVRDGDRLAVYPAFRHLSLAGVPPLRPPVPQPARFLLDIHLGQLARYLRLLGFDTRYPDHNHHDAQLARLAKAEGRILLTRDRGLLKRGLVVHGYCLRSRQPRQQLLDVLERYQLADAIRPWPRCLRCNGTLVAVERDAVWHLLEPKTRRYYNDFQQCQACGQVYWKGSHFGRMQQFVAGVLHELARSKAAA